MFLRVAENEKLRMQFYYKCSLVSSMELKSDNCGGVAVVVRKNISHELLPDINTELIENLGIKIKLTDNTFVNIYSCYFPGGSPGSSDTKKTSFKSDLRKFSRTLHSRR